MATALLEGDRVLSMVEQRLKDVQAPLNVRLWNGRALAPMGPSPVTLTVRSPQALMNLVNPSLGKLAKSYVEGEIDLEGVVDGDEVLDLDQPAQVVGVPEVVELEDGVLVDEIEILFRHLRQRRGQDHVIDGAPWFQLRG
jgi:hypothetical protein